MKYAVTFVHVTCVIFHAHKFDADNVDKMSWKRFVNVLQILPFISYSAKENMTQ